VPASRGAAPGEMVLAGTRFVKSMRGSWRVRYLTQEPELLRLSSVLRRMPRARDIGASMAGVGPGVRRADMARYIRKLWHRLPAAPAAGMAVTSADRVAVS
jgi:hypothetical protein